MSGHLHSVTISMASPDFWCISAHALNFLGSSDLSVGIATQRNKKRPFCGKRVDRHDGSVYRTGTRNPIASFVRVSDTTLGHIEYCCNFVLEFFSEKRRPKCIGRQDKKVKGITHTRHPFLGKRCFATNPSRTLPELCGAACMPEA